MKKLRWLEISKGDLVINYTVLQQIGMNHRSFYRFLLTSGRCDFKLKHYEKLLKSINCYFNSFLITTSSIC